MSPSQGAFWESVKIRPLEWSLSPWGDAGGGFRVVAKCSNVIVYYNDIEGGFECSCFSESGAIGEYGANQDELNRALSRMAERTEAG